MTKTVLAAVAASALLAPTLLAPANSQGRKVGHQPKVCLVTFGAETGNTGADADVIKAQYVPLPIAMKLEARNDTLADIYTYGATGFSGAGVDFHVAAPNDPALGITPEMNTEQVCNILAAAADDEDED